MPFNLIETPWIPVRTRSGSIKKIQPWRLTEDLETDPIERLYAPRPDFNAALIQFLIGLIQTSIPPEDEDDWLGRLERPPSPDYLKRNFIELIPSFNLDGTGPRFLQDFDELSGEAKPVSTLLIESPGEKTIEDNKDHFIKRNIVNRLCLPCATTALFTLQTNAPSGGAGHRTSLRGGGPLSTLLVDTGQPLWNMVSLNTLPKLLFAKNVGGNSDLRSDADIFPWMAPTRVSDSKDGFDTTPLDVNPHQIFWAMPRRIRLNFEKMPNSACDLCHGPSDYIVKTFITKNYGVNYVGQWNHPLTPHYRVRDSALLPRLCSANGISYRDWLGLVVNDQERGHEAAYRIRQFVESESSADKRLRLWAFGFDMDNMKAKCWYEGVMPIVTVSSEMRDQYETGATRLIKSSQAVGNNLISAVKESWFVRPSEAKGDLGMIGRLYWIRTESFFYDSLNQLKQAADEHTDTENILRNWHNKIARQALAIFDEMVLSGQFEQEDTKRMVNARNRLIKFNWSKQIIEQILEIPIKPK